MMIVLQAETDEDTEKHRGAWLKAQGGTTTREAAAADGTS